LFWDVDDVSKGRDDGDINASKLGVGLPVFVDLVLEWHRNTEVMILIAIKFIAFMNTK